jgi:hypothetical protein
MAEMRNAYSILVGKPEGKNHSVDLGIDGKIILEGILREYGGKMWTGCIWLRIWTNSRAVVNMVMKFRVP